MTQWLEDFSECSVGDILRLQAENRAWSKQLRVRASVLVNNRLAKMISRDDYVSGRKTDEADTAECRRRAAVLANEIASRQLLMPRR